MDEPSHNISNNTFNACGRISSNTFFCEQKKYFEIL